MTLREEVLRKPFGLAFGPEELVQEKDHIHFAGFIGEELVATAALVADGHAAKMQRVAVKPECQGQGTGTCLLNFIEQEARSRGFSIIYCSARDEAVKFYLNNRYNAEGEYYLEEGISHIFMRKLLLDNVKPCD